MIGRTGGGWILVYVGIFGSRKSESYLVSCGELSRHTQSPHSQTKPFTGAPSPIDVPAETKFLGPHGVVMAYSPVTCGTSRLSGYAEVSSMTDTVDT